MATPAYDQLLERYAEIKDLEGAQSILGWDQEVMMPAGGGAARAHSMASLAGVLHAKRTAPELRKLLGSLKRGRAKLKPRERRSLELAQHAVDKASAIPARLATEIAHAESAGLEAWRAAREARDVRGFVPALERMVGLKREVAALRGKPGKLYDPLLDEFEPGATMAEIDPLLTELKELTVPLVKRVVASGVKPNMKPFVGRFKVDAQRAFAREICLAMGIDPERSRMDLSTHPFCGGVAPDDVRMTSRYDPRDTRGGLFGAIHEAGHGLYEQGLDARRARTPLGGAISSAVHESQSRLWENNVGRGKPFWTYWARKLRAAHPQLKGLSVDKIVAAANEMRPSLIRVEADELTYNLHIVLRYEIERDLIQGELEVRELRDRWNTNMSEMLGVTPRHDTEGVLQDIHWAMGLFGYFPTYSLGNLYAAQFMATARKQIRGLDGRIAKGDMEPLREWLRVNIHRHDQVYTAGQLVKRVTGAPLSVDAFRTYITAKVDALYH
ncbi:MAG: carboxypeptidase M32 [Planctomycetota bacterium]|nr:MAG: carboxypeptidase M32 [Planctomycetota bacterium]